MMCNAVLDVLLNRWLARSVHPFVYIVDWPRSICVRGFNSGNDSLWSTIKMNQFLFSSFSTFHFVYYFVGALSLYAGISAPPVAAATDTAHRDP